MIKESKKQSSGKGGGNPHGVLAWTYLKTVAFFLHITIQGNLTGCAVMGILRSGVSLLNDHITEFLFLSFQLWIWISEILPSIQ